MPPANPLKIKPYIQESSAPDLSAALCAQEGLDPETWFVDDAVMAKVAKGYCNLCPVSQECYDQAIIEEIGSGYFAFGIRGGFDAAHRQKQLDYLKLRKELGYDD
jgi:hypothetical protein